MYQTICWNYLLKITLLCNILYNYRHTILFVLAIRIISRALQETLDEEIVTFYHHRFYFVSRFPLPSRNSISFQRDDEKLRFATLAVLTFGEISHLLLRQLNASRFLNLLSFDVRECSPRTWMLAVRKNVDIRLSISRSRSVRLALKVWPRFKVHLSPVTNSVLARSKCFYSFTFSSFVASIKSFFSVPRYLV